MKTIDILRTEIDKIDDALADLYEKRMALCKEIGLNKANEGRAVNVTEREKQIVNRITQGRDDEMKRYLKLLYDTIFFQSKNYQGKFVKTKSQTVEKLREIIGEERKSFPISATVACQGVSGAYSGVAADKLFDISEVTYFKTFDAVFSAVDQGLCEYGVLPIENSNAGSVSQVYDLMKKHKFYIVKSVRVQISHALCAKKGVKVEEIKTVYSHSQALMQCAEHLKRLGVKTVEVENTAVAAKIVAESEDRSIGAICSDDCAEIYNLCALERAMQDSANNFTRFICISKDMKVFKGADKISVMTSLANKAGSLNKMLNRFATLGLNLTKLESRPIANSQFEFMFYFDFEGEIENENVLNLLGELDNSSDKFVFLGSYKEII
ncbi:MAG: bifunctional chorismate mutase/prephenate dehydratase [Clostridiales bacterium]|nr:bifunctional chorismate mutase/prephenate dehydratase [Clostridiales bacterium]